jgi:hypothetical protein
MIGRNDLPTIEQIRERVHALPQPYKYHALGNLRDADRDLVLWPDSTSTILLDCHRAVAEWERLAAEAGE